MIILKKYNREETNKIIDEINKMQRFIFKYKKEQGIEPTKEEIVKGINITDEDLEEINYILNEFKKQDEELDIVPLKHTKEDIKKAREIRNHKREGAQNE